MAAKKTALAAPLVPACQVITAPNVCPAPDLPWICAIAVATAAAWWVQKIYRPVSVMATLAARPAIAAPMIIWAPIAKKSAYMTVTHVIMSRRSARKVITGIVTTVQNGFKPKTMVAALMALYVQ